MSGHRKRQKPPAKFEDFPFQFLDKPSKDTPRLKKISAPLFSLSKRILVKTGHPPPLFVFASKDKTVMVPLPDVLAQFFNDGTTKDFLFRQMREVGESVKADTIAFVSDAMFSTSIGKITGAQMEELTANKSTQELVDSGMFVSHEAMVVTAQTRERVLITTLLYQRVRGRIVTDPRGASEMEMAQAEFHGRGKFFGPVGPQYFHDHDAGAKPS